MNPRRARGPKGRFVKSRRRRRRNPIALAANPRRRRRRRNPIAFAANPRRRRRRNPIAFANPRRRRRRNPRASYRRRRNPSMRNMLSLRGLTGALMPAAIGGAGALGVDLMLGYIPLPAWFDSPTGRIVARVGGAFALGVLASFVVPRRTATLITAGALTVTAYNALREYAPLAGISPPAYGGDYSDTRLSYVSPAPMLQGRGMGAYMRSTVPAGTGMGAYMRDSLDPVNNLSGVTGDGL